MRVAVTGSEGFLGKMLCAKLRELGYKVVECRKDNCNILDEAQLTKAFYNADAVIHLAAILDEGNPEMREVNVKGTENVLEACTANPVKQLVYVSTAGVYGSTLGIKNEETIPKPETPYEKSKLEAEKKVLSYQEVFHITILRLALVIGPNEYWKSIIKAVKKGFPLIGDGKNHWQLVAAEDAAEAIAFTIGKEQCYGETFIVAEKEAPTLEETITTMRTALGMNGPTAKVPVWLGNTLATLNSALHFNPLLRLEYIKRLQADRLYSTKKLETAGWKARHSTKEYLHTLVKELSFK